VIDWECTCQIWEKELIPAKFANKILKNIYKLLKFKAIIKYLELPHQETIVGINTLQTKPFDNQKTEIMSNNKQQTAVNFLIKEFSDILGPIETKPMQNLLMMDAMKRAKEMEKEKHEKFNKLLNDEKQLGISDLKTIERIQWYYNTYFNETYGGNK
jgi:hypothetical protein